MTILYTTVVDRSIKICIFLSKFILTNYSEKSFETPNYIEFSTID
jgi:hypothetical protein